VHNSNLTWQLLVPVLIVLFLVVAVFRPSWSRTLAPARGSWGTFPLFEPLGVHPPRPQAGRGARPTRNGPRTGIIAGSPEALSSAARLDSRPFAGSNATASARRLPQSVSRPSSRSRWKAQSGFLIGGRRSRAVVGAMLLFYPNAESMLEKFANRWVSPRRVTRSWDDMHMNLDHLSRPIQARRWSSPALPQRR